jgi:biopolymer transport protein ExbB
LIYRAVLKQEDIFVKEIRRKLTEPKEAIAICDQSGHLLASVFKAGLVRLEQRRNKEQITLTIESRTAYVVAQLERHLNTLATISGAAPMLGFLGTVIGMVLAFKEMAMSAGQADISQLAGGIYTALTTTVAGLVVGIISYIAYNQLVNLLQRITQRFESLINTVLEEL